MSRFLPRRPTSWIVLRSLWEIHRRSSEPEREAGFRFEEIYDAILDHADPPPDFRVVASYLKLLEGRGLLLSRKTGRIVRYRPAGDERTAVATEIDLFLDEVIHDDPVLLDDLLRKAQERQSETGSKPS